ncbi:MAG: insulinase family protein, partial [Ruminiclostridium sp.]
MKKILSLTLTLCLILSMCFQLTIDANAAETALKPLPQVGEVISGFKTIEVGNMELINSKTVLFEHEKTGAKLIYVQNKDIDRSFNITFRTPAVDNTGANHILEHVSVSGSQKYPLKNVLFTVMNQTYSTFINAFTYPTFTTYPVSSMSEDQLLKLTDVYLDCVYHPSVYADKNIFSREAWRYEMSDANAPLSINGTVYNEMKGALGNISAAASENVLSALFTNSIQSNVSGGKPDDIKDLTYEQLKETHNTYYHPSNSLMILYGNLDYRKFLKLINDEYLLKYVKKNIKIDTGKVTPSREKVDKTFKFPVSATSNTKYASQIDYAYALTDVSEEDSLGLSIIAALLNQETSPLKQAFNGKQIGGSVSVGYSEYTTQPVLAFSVQNADESKKAEFKTLVDNCIKDILKTGFDKAATDAIISATLLSNSNLTEMGNLGINLSLSLDSMWANGGNTNYLNNLIQNIKDIQTKAKGNFLENLVTKYIVNNSFAALVTTIPEAGLAEKQTSADQKYLSDLKAAMSKEEIQKIVDATKAYNEWNSKEENQKIVEDLKVVNIADLPEEVKKYDIKETLSSDGIKLISTEANVGETEITSLSLDTSSVPIDKLHYLQLFSSLLGSLDTTTYTQEQLNTLRMRYLGGAGFNANTISQKSSKQFTPYLSISWMGLIGEYDKQIELVKDILLNTKFDNTEDISNKVKTQIANLKTSFTGEPLGILMSRNLAQFDDNSNYLNYISGLEYYNFLTQLDKTLASDPKTVVAELKGINDLVLNKTNIITTFAGNKTNIKKYEDTIKILTDALPAKKITKQDYTLIQKPALKEGIAVDSTVQYNMISASYEKLGTAFSGKYLPIAALINEKYTTPRIRFGNGAYGNIENFTSNGFYVTSYRDPNIKETFEIFKGLPDFLKNIDITQADLDSYILKTYSNYSAPSGELAGASTAINSYLTGESADERLKVLHEIKSLTVKDVKDLSIVIENLLKNGAYSTAGSIQKLTDNKELYDTIISVDQGTNGQGTAETLTRAQLFEIILAGIPDPLDVAKQQGLLTGDSKGNYNENKKLTKEELAVIIYKIAVL